MGLIAEFNFSGPNNKEYGKFIILFMTIIFGWTLISRWSHFLDVLFFSFFGLQRNSLYHAFFIAVVLSAVFFAIVYYMNSREPMTE